MIRTFHLCVFLAWGAAGMAQEVTISMDVNRVALYATVKEGKAGYVADLGRENFIVKDNGTVQEIREFSREDVPLAIGLVIDNSGSMMNKRGEVIAAAKAFIRESKPEDEIFILHFNDFLRFGLPEGVKFSSDQKVLDQALEKHEVSGQTALYDAIDLALRRLKESKLTKKALVVISDGGDNVSGRKITDVIRAADLSGALFYAVGIYDAMDGDVNPGALRKLGTATGGETWFPKSISELTRICESAARELRSQYTIVYSPDSKPDKNGYHRVQVSVKDTKKRNLTVRARTGYYDRGVGESAAPGGLIER